MVARQSRERRLAGQRSSPAATRMRPAPRPRRRSGRQNALQCLASATHAPYGEGLVIEASLLKRAQQVSLWSTVRKRPPPYHSLSLSPPPKATCVNSTYAFATRMQLTVALFINQTNLGKADFFIQTINFRITRELNAYKPPMLGRSVMLDLNLMNYIHATVLQQNVTSLSEFSNTASGWGVLGEIH